MRGYWLAWLHWNPERILFYMPVVDRPIARYGVWFAFGFIVGYFLALSICTSIFSHSHRLTARDVLNWNRLEQHIKNNPTLAQGFNLSPSTSLSQEEMLALLNQAASLYGWNRKRLTYLFPKALYTPRALAVLFADKLTWFVIIGTLLGARLGHVFFYDWPYYQEHLTEIYKIWKGGLASHGGTFGILGALYIFQRRCVKRFPEFHFLGLLDLMAIPVAFGAACIRIGNFFNQEILGTETAVPWAIVFEDPADGSLPIPRHPVQLYEACAYVVIFVALCVLWKRWKGMVPQGLLSGLLLFSLFSSRFFLEFLKIPQSIAFDESFLQMGQYLSIPFILLGMALLRTSYRSYQESACGTRDRPFVHFLQPK